MNALALGSSLALSLCLAALLTGSDAGTAAPPIPTRSSHLGAPYATQDVKIWAAAEHTSTLFGLSSDAKRVLETISTEAQAVKGGEPLTLKVDHAQNLFVADVSGGRAGVIQEYSDGTFARAYSPVCPVSHCSKFTGVLGDSVVDSNHVFAIMKRIQYQLGSRTVTGSGYEYWPNGNPSATPVTSLFSSDCSAICDIDAGDEDQSGNLWVRDYGGGTSYGVAEITNPATNPSFNQILSLETFTIDSGDIAGFYISAHGTVLNVGDSSHNIYQYALPLAYGGLPFNTLTPCSQGCDPHGFGFNSTDTLIVAGDGQMAKDRSKNEGWLDIGRLSNNHWKQVGNPQFTVSLSSAVYTPSDK